MLLITSYQVEILSSQEMQTFRNPLMDAKKEETENYTNLLKGAIELAINTPLLNEQTALDKIRPLLTKSGYENNDGYFFLYNPKGVNLLHPAQKKLEGKDLSANPVIQNILKKANHGGGFAHYQWHRPSTRKKQDKISYVTKLDRWGWVLGTGFYLDEINAEITHIEKQVKEDIRRVLYMILAVTISSTVLLGLWINWRENRLANAQLRESAHKFIAIQVDERRHFSRELHDGINQLIVAAKHRIELAIRLLNKEQTGYLEQLDQARSTLVDAIQEVRHISHNLRPRLLDDMGLKVALENLFTHYREHSQIALVFDYALNEQISLAKEIEISLYRIIQEALMNIEKHANAQHVVIKIHPEKNAIVLDIHDDGCGFAMTKIHQHANTGIGLKNMQERVTLLGGRLTLNSSKKTGTHINIHLSKED
jgi:two-component system NarL family sensor kinase